MNSLAWPPIVAFCSVQILGCEHFREVPVRYPLARNQHINNSPGNLSCIRAGANAGATYIRTEMASLKNVAPMRKMIPQKDFPVFARVRMQAPSAFAQKLVSQEFFPARMGFVPGGIFQQQERGPKFIGDVSGRF